MTSLSDRQYCIALIDEAVASGASLYKACSVIEVHHKTYRRWVSAGAVKADGRPGPLWQDSCPSVNIGLQ